MSLRLVSTLVEKGLRPPELTFPAVEFQVDYTFSSGEMYTLGVSNQEPESLSSTEVVIDTVQPESFLGFSITPKTLTEDILISFTFTYYVDNVEFQESESVTLDASNLDGDDFTYSVPGKVYLRTGISNVIYQSIRIYPANSVTTDVIPSLYKPVETVLHGYDTSLRSAFDDKITTTLSSAYLTDISESARNEYTAVISSIPSSNITTTTAYGHYAGSGSYDELQLGKSPSSAIYSSIQIALGQSGNTKISLFDSVVDDFYLFTLNNLTVDVLSVSHFELNLKQLNGDSVSEQYNTGSNISAAPVGNTLTLTPDAELYENHSGLDVYKLMSGSLSDGLTGDMTVYGYYLPGLKSAILRADQLDSYLEFNTVRLSQIADNPVKLARSFIGALANNNRSVIAFGRRTKLARAYECKISARNHNYSLNPTYSRAKSGSFGVTNTSPREKYGRFRYESKALDGYATGGNPFSYVTSIGLYDDDYKLLAVIKLSSPVLKSEEVGFSIIAKVPNEV